MASNVGGSFWHLLPVVVPEQMTARGITMAINPWQAPAFSGMVGTTGEPAEPALAVTLETPLSWLRTAQPLDKFEREWLCVRRYSCDQALATRVHAFADVRPGDDPPDTTVQTDSG